MLQRLGAAPWMDRLPWRPWGASLHPAEASVQLSCYIGPHWFTRWSILKTETAWHSDLSSTIKDCIGIFDCHLYFSRLSLATNSCSKVQPKQSGWQPRISLFIAFNSGHFQLSDFC
mmetsp:Transcript_59815/g.97741  ORF Transcript_59815/g.97741 Transcript_59815/m.97741 type:complete len:116 (+) Transcript_59815:1047-1394(+)